MTKIPSLLLLLTWRKARWNLSELMLHIKEQCTYLHWDTGKSKNQKGSAEEFYFPNRFCLCFSTSILFFFFQISVKISLFMKLLFARWGLLWGWIWLWTRVSDSGFLLISWRFTLGCLSTSLSLSFFISLFIFF